MNLITSSETETSEAGRLLARELTPGTVVLLRGDLGAGKTAFVRGMAEGLGCAVDDVSSPTFTIVQEYRGRTTLQHVDLYRLTSKEADDLALEDLMGDAVMAIEWPERWARAATVGTLHVTIDIIGDTQRRIGITRAGDQRTERSEGSS